jgi:hypothetical protein
MSLRELININTQVRRLGYIPALLHLASNQYLGAEILYSKFLTWGMDNQEYLKNYVNSTGDIVPQQKKKPAFLRAAPQRIPNAVRSYVEFAHDMEWIIQISGVYALSRLGQVLPALEERLATNKSPNPFLLSLTERVFFIHQLWDKDRDVLYTILRLLDTGPTPLKQLQETFSKAFQQHLLERIQHTNSEFEKNEFLDRYNDIELRWMNPVKYAEQYVPTRLNWLVDLGLVNIENRQRRNCSLTSLGQEFKINFSPLSTLTDSWLESNLFKVLAASLGADDSLALTRTYNSQDKSVLIDSLRMTLRLFRSGPVPRFSITQVTLFLCIYLLVTEGVAVDYRDVLSTLAEPIPFDKDHVIETRLSARSNEAYIILNPV